jgi:sugar lactone lactonase YvrE
MARAEQVTGPHSEHGEGPVWWPGWGGLRWVDLLAGDLMSLDDAGEVQRRKVSSVLAAQRPRTGGGAVLALERGFALEDPDGTLHVLPEVWSDTSIRMNDGGCDPHGRFYCGSMHYDEVSAVGSLFRLEADGSVTPVLGGSTVSNGLEWSPDGTLAYYSDSAIHRVDVFDYSADNGLTGRRVFVDLTADEELPDGLTVDAEGGVWVAVYGAGSVRRYDPSGRLDEVVEVAASNVTACTFGGADLDRLYITTSRRGVDAGLEPAAGAVFSYDAGVRGQPARTFAG